MLISLYERAVGLYALLVGINAYHQPGVEAGKKAAGEIIELQTGIQSFLVNNQGVAFTAEEIAKGMNRHAEAEAIFKICRHLAINGSGGVTVKKGLSPTLTKFSG